MRSGQPLQFVQSQPQDLFPAFLSRIIFHTIRLTMTARIRTVMIVPMRIPLKQTMIQPHHMIGIFPCQIHRILKRTGQKTGVNT